MNQKAIAPWAGAKRKLAGEIVPMLGSHSAYWEPFCGGMAVLLAKPECRMEIVNDLHGDLTNLARVIQDERAGPKLYRRLRRVLFSQEIHKEAQAKLTATDDPLERAYLYFIKVWMSWGGVAGSAWGSRRMSIRYTNNGGHQAKRFHEAVNSIPSWRRRMRNVTVLNGNAFELIAKIDDARGVVVYADPPYIENKVDYEHSFAPLDHVQLSHLLHRFKKTRVVLSYYAHPAIDDLYPGWQRREIHVTKAIAQIAKRNSQRQRAVEVLLTNQRLGGNQKELWV